MRSWLSEAEGFAAGGQASVALIDGTHPQIGPRALYGVTAGEPRHASCVSRPRRAAQLATQVCADEVPGGGLNE